MGVLVVPAESYDEGTASTSTATSETILETCTKEGVSFGSCPVHSSALFKRSCRYHKGVRQGSGVYKFKGLPAGGVHSHAAESEEGNTQETPGTQAEGGLYIGEWNSGFMQGLGILKYDDGER